VNSLVDPTAFTAPVITIADCVDRHARERPDAPALIEHSGRTVTYSQLHDSSRALAAGLRTLGAQRGTRIATFVDDSAAYVELYIAAARIGAIMVPINTRLTAAEATVLVEDCDPLIVVWTGRHTPVMTEVPTTGRVNVVIDADPAMPGAVAFEDLESTSFDDTEPHVLDADDPYIIGYTSGTTGRPKGAVMTHATVRAIAESNTAAYRLPENSVAALTGSMSFVATVPAHVLTHLRIGGTVVVLGPWTVSSLLDAVQRYSVTFTYVPSPVIGEFVEAVTASPRRIASLHTVLHSASNAGPEKLRALYDAIGDRLVEGLGMTENSGGLVTATRVGDFEPTSAASEPFQSVGRAVDGTDIDVVDENGVTIPHDGTSVGEIVVRSPALMTGYWNMPDATARSIVDGWYHTGDLGAMDAAGFVYVSDRRTDLIVSGGMNVYPSEVEATVAAHPAVAECAIVGAPHPRWGQSVVAVVVLVDGAELTLEELQDHCRTSLASYKKPTRIVVLESLPRTASMKIKRNVVRDAVLAG
jgi:fatty-acyl-CoA synthase